ncbi:estradiol 17-beta-dehydrogenase 8-like isoform X2 [Photinus pyralis]|nr:estradiol 17-beta-dehydrogenase 8-like isoform X2 [Photinus pyralis]
MFVVIFVLFIAGGGSGIGRAACQVLAREGAQVVAADRNLKSAEETIGTLQTSNSNGASHHSSHLVDVSNFNSVKSSLNQILEKYKKPPSIVVNCAGINRNNFILDMTEEEFDDVMNVNLKGTFLVIKIFAQAIIENKVPDASFVNIGSTVAKFGNITQANYGASKAGVELVTKTVVKEFSKHGIRCNTILPGVISTPMTNLVPAKDLELVLPLIACERIGHAEEVAEVIAFLASSKSSYVNGAAIEVNGGWKA